MADSNIEWTDKVWNPVTGCAKVSAGCANCYAETVHNNRHKGYLEALKRGEKPKLPKQYAVPFEKVVLHEDRLEAPFHWREPKKIFVNSMSDLFHEDVPDKFIDRVFRTAGAAIQHTFQILTKRPKRMKEYCENHVGFKNIWLGVSVETQKIATERLPLLFQTPAAVRFLSVEPMLERIDMPWRLRMDGKLLVDWVICGGESGPKARPFNIEWARVLRDYCKGAGVPFFMKQLGGRPFWEQHLVGACSPKGFKDIFPIKDRKGGDMAEWPEDLRVRQFPIPSYVVEKYEKRNKLFRELPFVPGNGPAK